MNRDADKGAQGGLIHDYNTHIIGRTRILPSRGDVVFTLRFIIVSSSERPLGMLVKVK
jgi:hypothetical protein